MGTRVTRLVAGAFAVLLAVAAGTLDTSAVAGFAGSPAMRVRASGRPGTADRRSVATPARRDASRVATPRRREEDAFPVALIEPVPSKIDVVLRDRRANDPPSPIDGVLAALLLMP